MSQLEEIILKKIGKERVLASDLYVRGYDNAELSQALLSLELDGKIELVDFETLVREDGGLVSVGVYRQKQ